MSGLLGYYAASTCCWSNGIAVCFFFLISRLSYAAKPLSRYNIKSVLKIQPFSFVFFLDLRAVFPREASCYYFSFTTLTAPGYGDIVPRSNFTKILANMEAIAGQVYLAVFIARLVGLHIAQELKQA
ncbi:MAG: potassium channel family protein [Planctomycetota bacterium]|jgi:hypothetical protein